MRAALRFDTFEQLQAWANRKKNEPPPRRYPTEEEEQIALIQWARLSIPRYPELMLLAHIPNGGFRHRGEAIKLAKMGVLAGIPDLILSVPRRGAHCLYIELKAKDGTPSPLQLQMAARLVSVGNCVAFCFGFHHARKTLEWYLEDT